MSAPLFSLGVWDIDPRANVIRNGEISRHLDPRAMDVLVYMCQHPNTVLSADQLLAACWRGADASSNDNSLYKVINQLRRALDDSRTDSQYIETIRKRGYRIVADVNFQPKSIPVVWDNSSPFRGLEPFDEQHAAVFFGRKKAVAELTEMALVQASTGCAMALVLGPSGSGKTSIVRAGLIPYLLALQPDASATPYCVLHFDCADISDNDPFSALASTLLDGEINGEPLFPDRSAIALGQYMASRPEAFVTELQTCLGKQKLLLFVDRLEALLRLAPSNNLRCSEFANLLEQLARSGSALIILACRNDFYPDLVTYPQFKDLIARGGQMNLAPPNTAELVEIIRESALAAQLHYGSDDSSGERLDDALINAAAYSPDALPLLQYCLQELYQRRSASGELLFNVYRELGGLEGALGARAEQIFSELDKVQRDTLPTLLKHLVIVSEQGNAVTARRVPWDTLNNSIEKELARVLVESRLFVSDLVNGLPMFGITHEALLRHWPRISTWIADHRQLLQARAHLSSQALRWQDSGCANDLLLPRGMQIHQAEQLLDSALPLDRTEIAFIRASIQLAKKSEQRRKMFMGMLVLLTLIAGGFGILAKVAQQSAEHHRNEVEGMVGYMLGEFAEKLRPIGKLELLDSVSNKAMTYLSDLHDVKATEAKLSQRAKALNLIAEVKVARADYGGAQEALQAAHHILQPMLKSTTATPELLKIAGENAFWMGQIHFNKKEWDKAKYYFANYRDISERLVRASPQAPLTWMELSYAHNSLGSVALQRDDIQGAAKAFQLSVALKERALAQEPENKEWLASLADSVSWLANAHSSNGQLYDAKQHYDREIELYQTLRSAAPREAKWTHGLARAQAHKAEILLALGDTASARDYYRDAIAEMKNITLLDPSNRRWQLNLFSLELGLANIDIGLGDEVFGSSTRAKMASIDADIQKMSQLKPPPVNLTWLAARTALLHAELQLKLHQVDVAAHHSSLALSALLQLLEKSPDDKAIVRDLVTAYLLDAEILQQDHQIEKAHQQCEKARNLLSPLISSTMDYQYLSPWVRTHYCLGLAEATRTVRQTLTDMGYRNTLYLHYLSTHTIGKKAS